MGVDDGEKSDEVATAERKERGQGKDIMVNEPREIPRRSFDRRGSHGYHDGHKTVVVPTPGELPRRLTVVVATGTTTVIRPSWYSGIPRQSKDRRGTRGYHDSQKTVVVALPRGATTTVYLKNRRAINI
ncbi:hypothetical protein TIFTF001_036242 [Ficus carica]|uniref:Uncharacterized protein n=1 Tax=Ficus carica TaxID=3494 RepID=A0AA88E3V7_FICCA|nr:hypothetical protein TIFTF001_036242 [Ficus carica]